MKYLLIYLIIKIPSCNYYITGMLMYINKTDVVVIKFNIFEDLTFNIGI